MSAGEGLPGEGQVLFLHNPRCSKSRATEQLLGEQGVSYQERRYLDEPLTRAELEDLKGRLDRPVREWIRSSQPEFAALGLGAGSSEEELLGAIEREPVLLERPIVIHGDRARIGRPPGAVLELFD